MAQSNNTALASSARPSSGRLGVRIAGVLLLVLVVVVALFAWNRWFRYDDAADLQGVWTDESGAQLALDGQRMLVGDSVVYDYTVDAATKTIAYEFNDSKGYSAYRFSGDRTVLALRDVEQGGGTDWLMVLHLKEDPLLAALDPQAQTPQGCSRMQRSSTSAAEAFAAYESRPSGLQETTSGTILWPEDMKPSSDIQGAEAAQGAEGVPSAQGTWQDASPQGQDAYQDAGQGAVMQDAMYGEGAQQAYQDATAPGYADPGYEGYGSGPYGYQDGGYAGGQQAYEEQAGGAPTG